MKHISTENYRRIFRISQMLDIKVLIGCTILKNGIGNRHVLEHFDDEMANILFCQYIIYIIFNRVCQSEAAFLTQNKTLPHFASQLIYKKKSSIKHRLFYEALQRLLKIFTYMLKRKGS